MVDLFLFQACSITKIFASSLIQKKNDVMILPNEMYNADGCDLLGEKIHELELYYNAKIILA